MNVFNAIAAAILYCTGFEVWGDMQGPFRAITFALAFWQTALAIGGGVNLPTLGKRTD